ncbi:MAG: enoyl-CoA hydratase [Pseudomonadaceae bacterium]|nr:enoyl-CoA hydratase [Pseudomonadaceae bacterium]
MTSVSRQFDELIDVRREGSVAWLTLNRPKQYNALSLSLLEALSKDLEQALSDSEIGVIVLAANGPGFCAGHDLKEVQLLVRERNETALRALLDTCNRLMVRIMTAPKPVIACVHSLATAAGCQLVAACDLAVASSEARFATPGVNIGLFCSTPSVPLTRNLPRKFALQMLLTGDTFTAEDARRMALINEITPPETLTERCQELASHIASRSQASIGFGKPLYQIQIDQGLDEAFASATEVMLRNLLDDDAAEGIDAVLGKREPVWPSSNPRP